MNTTPPAAIAASSDLTRRWSPQLHRPRPGAQIDLFGTFSPACLSIATSVHIGGYARAGSASDAS